MEPGPEFPSSCSKKIPWGSGERRPQSAGWEERSQGHDSHDSPRQRHGHSPGWGHLGPPTGLTPTRSRRRFCPPRPARSPPREARKPPAPQPRPFPVAAAGHVVPRGRRSATARARPQGRTQPRVPSRPPGRTCCQSRQPHQQQREQSRPHPANSSRRRGRAVTCARTSPAPPAGGVAKPRAPPALFVPCVAPSLPRPPPPPPRWRRPAAPCGCGCCSTTRRRAARAARCAGCCWSPARCASSPTSSASSATASASAGGPTSASSSTGRCCPPPRAPAWCGTTTRCGTAGMPGGGERSGHRPHCLRNPGCLKRAVNPLRGGNSPQWGERGPGICAPQPP